MSLNVCQWGPRKSLMAHMGWKAQTSAKHKEAMVLICLYKSNFVQWCRGIFLQQACWDRRRFLLPWENPCSQGAWHLPRNPPCEQNGLALHPPYAVTSGSQMSSWKLSPMHCRASGSALRRWPYRCTQLATCVCRDTRFFWNIRVHPEDVTGIAALRIPCNPACPAQIPTEPHWCLKNGQAIGTAAVPWCTGCLSFVQRVELH